VEPVALRLLSPDEPCISKYVAADGLLADTPVFQIPAQWSTVYVRGEEIIPDTTYMLQVETSYLAGPTSEATTWIWGDVDHNDVVNLDDIMRIIQVYQGNFSLATMENVDQMPCTPNRVISLEDILWCMQSFEGKTYADTMCPLPCR
jgi:hypothetical protein